MVVAQPMQALPVDEPLVTRGCSTPEAVTPAPRLL
jgi:hypothetical protein